MSIYIAIPTLYDNQINFTVEEAIRNAVNPDQLSICLVFMDTQHKEIDCDNFFKEKILPLKKYNQVKIKRFSSKEHESGVGFGRNEAMSMYNGEDYILQIDSHTKFDKKWDVILIDIFSEALKVTKNEKTILTAYLPAYAHDDANVRGNFGTLKLAKYPFFVTQFRFDGGLPSWTDTNLVEGDLKVDEIFVPSVKFNAQFAFSNKNFYENYGLPKSVVFWEEELIQTINLLDSGFSLVFPNQTLPLSHLFQDDVNKDLRSNSFRVSGANTELLDAEQYNNKIRKTYFDFIEDPANKSKIDRFYKYARVHPIHGPYMINYIPKEYNH